MGLLQTETFLSFWYWFGFTLYWASACNGTFGVPNELTIRAGESARAMAAFEPFARRNVARIVEAGARRGWQAALFSGFFISTLATLAVTRRSEFALGILVIIAPSICYGFASLRWARRITERDLDGMGLRREFLRARVAGWVTALVSLFGALLALGLLKRLDVYFDVRW